MKREIGVGDGYALTKHKQFNIRYISLLAVLTTMCLYAVKQVSAQQAEPAATAVVNIKPLEIGDTIPEYLWRLPLQVVNHAEGKDTITLNDYRDKKLIILDFWATWCGPCVKSLHNLDSLQAAFNDNIFVLPLTKESRDKAVDFISKRYYSLVFAANEQRFPSYFPHVVLPHQVWLVDGVVKTITNHRYATPSNIERVLQDKRPITIEKEDKWFEYDTDEPLLLTDSINVKEGLLWYSTITKYLEGAPNSFRVSPNIYAGNRPILALYQHAFQNAVSRYERNSRVIIEFTDTPLDVVRPPDNLKTGVYEDDLELIEWTKSNTFCYNLIFDTQIDVEASLEIMQDDLNRFFGLTLGIKGTIEKRRMLALALVETAEKPSQKYETLPGNKNAIILKNQTVDRLVSALVYACRKINFPIVDRTVSKPVINMVLNADGRDLQSLRQELQYYGYDLVLGEYDVDVLVLTDK